MELSILNLSSNLIRNSNDETNFPHKLLSPIIKFPKTQLCSMIQSGSVKIGISGLDNFVNFQLEMANSYLKKLSMQIIKT